MFGEGEVMPSPTSPPVLQRAPKSTASKSSVTAEPKIAPARTHTDARHTHAALLPNKHRHPIHIASSADACATQ